jgi:hypothetical protein
MQYYIIFFKSFFLGVQGNNCGSEVSLTPPPKKEKKKKKGQM